MNYPDQCFTQVPLLCGYYLFQNNNYQRCHVFSELDQALPFFFLFESPISLLSSLSYVKSIQPFSHSACLTLSEVNPHPASVLTKSPDTLQNQWYVFQTSSPLYISLEISPSITFQSLDTNRRRDIAEPVFFRCIAQSNPAVSVSLVWFVVPVIR